MNELEIDDTLIIDTLKLIISEQQRVINALNEGRAALNDCIIRLMTHE